VADLNLPIAPGDTIRTTERRCEIQFDTGTVIRLDRNTELKVETILAQCLSSKKQLTNLLLLRGQIYVMYKRYVWKEIFQIITPNTAVKLNHKSVVLIESVVDGNTDIHMSEGKGYALFGPDENSIKRKAVKKSKKIIVTSDHQVIAGQYEEIEEFEAWNEKLNREFLEFHEGKAVIPLPIQKLSKGVYYFAQKYSNLYGEWLWDSYCGYVWRPFLNDHSYPWGGWTPYYHGRWTSVSGQLFWVPSEPWGWVPYHLGIWMWNKKKGWLWIPGSVFAPAWVDWAFIGDFCSWRPWMLMDWYGYSAYRDGQLPYYAYWIYPDNDLGMDPTIQDSGEKGARQTLSKDQLKSKKTAPYPMPKELKETYKRVVVALENGEDWVLSPLKEVPNHLLVVSQEDLNAPNIHEKAVKLSSISQNKSIDLLFQELQRNPHHRAKQTYLRNEKMATLREKINDIMSNVEGLEGLDSQEFLPSKVIVTSPKNAAQGSWGQNPELISPNRSSARFRDWNPDIKVARRAGVSIRYSSRSNEVRCPELNLSSRHVEGSRGYVGPRVKLTSQGPVASSGLGGVISSFLTSSSQSGPSDSNTSGSGSKSGVSSAKSGKGKKK
jgi:hypothetical protein